MKIIVNIGEIEIAFLKHLNQSFFNVFLFYPPFKFLIVYPNQDIYQSSYSNDFEVKWKWYRNLKVKS